MATARQLFAEEGVEAVTMRRVAEVSEWSVPVIYQHFVDKDELLHALCVEDFDRLAVSFQAVAGEPDPLIAIRRCAQAYAAFGVEHPHHYQLLFMRACPPLDDADMAKRGDPARDGYAFLRFLVERAMLAKALHPPAGDIELATQTLWAAAHGVVSLEIAKGKDPWVPWTPLAERLRTMIDAVLAGMA